MFVPSAMTVCDSTPEMPTAASAAATSTAAASARNFFERRTRIALPFVVYELRDPTLRRIELRYSGRTAVFPSGPGGGCRQPELERPVSRLGARAAAQLG